MPFDSILLVYGAVFLVVLLLVEGVFYLVADSRGGAQAANRRLRMLASGASSEEVYYKLRRTKKDEGSLISRFGPRGILAHFDRLIMQAGLVISTSRLLMIMGGLTFFAFLLAWGVARTPASATLAGSLVLGSLLPYSYVSLLRHRRQKRFLQQFPDALDLIVRSLRAGHPVSVSLGMVGKEMNDPIGTEFGIAVDEMTYGLDVRDALQNMSLRMPLAELYYLLVAISIQHGAGGNLAEVLDGLSKVIRSRFNMYQKIKALSAEGRMSAMVLGALPFVVAIAVWTLNPNYFRDVADDQLFAVLVSVAGGLLLAGTLLLWKLVRIRV